MALNIKRVETNADKQLKKQQKDAKNAAELAVNELNKAASDAVKKQEKEEKKEKEPPKGAAIQETTEKKSQSSGTKKPYILKKKEQQESRQTYSIYLKRSIYEKLQELASENEMSVSLVLEEILSQVL